MGNWVTLPAPAVTGYSGCTEVQALDENTLLVAGLSPPAGVEGLTPAFMKTTDGGQTWSGAAVPELGASSNGRAAQLHFADAMVGYMAWDSGVRTIAVTTDGGATWSASSVPAGEPQYVYAIDGTTALASGRIGTSSAIWRSTNTGKTWAPVYTGAQVVTAGRIMMFDDRVGLAQTERLLRTTDGGQSWSPLTVGFRWNGPWSTVSSTQAFVIFELVQTSRLYRTDDAGLTFTPVGTTVLPCRAFSMAFSDSTHGLVGCSNAQLHTSDGGMTWTTEAAPAGWANRATCMAWPSPMAAYALGAPNGDTRAIKRTGDPEPVDGTVDASVDGTVDAPLDAPSADASPDAASSSEAGPDPTNPSSGDASGGCCETGEGGRGGALIAGSLALVLARRRR